MVVHEKTVTAFDRRGRAGFHGPILSLVSVTQPESLLLGGISMNNMLEHYREVLKDLETRHANALRETKSLEQTIAGIRALMANSASLFIPARLEPTLPLEAPEMPSGQYAGMSVRWAILKMLAEDSAHPMKTPEITKALVAGGLRGKGEDFGASVSAVVSVMAKQRNEVERVPEIEGAYRLTENGRLAWAAIKHSPKYINRAAVATVQ